MPVILPPTFEFGTQHRNNRTAITHSATTPDALLAHAAQMLTPLAQLLISQGVGHATLSRALKASFVSAAREALSTPDNTPTDAAISLHAGVHRKDVKTLMGPAPEMALASASKRTDALTASGRLLSLAEQVQQRWLSEAVYQDEAGRPIVLNQTGPAPSLRELVKTSSTDVSPTAVLEQMLRLGLAERIGNQIAVIERPSLTAELEKSIAEFANHIHDQLSVRPTSLK